MNMTSLETTVLQLGRCHPHYCFSSPFPQIYFVNSPKQYSPKFVNTVDKKGDISSHSWVLVKLSSIPQPISETRTEKLKFSFLTRLKSRHMRASDSQAKIIINWNSHIMNWRQSIAVGIMPYPCNIPVRNLFIYSYFGIYSLGSMSIRFIQVLQIKTRWHTPDDIEQ